MKKPFDLIKARADTPACEDIIHFNNAGASLMPRPVSNALHSYLRSEEAIGGYESADLLENSLSQVYHSAAALLNCSENEIAFTESATKAWQLAFYSFKFNRGDKILTTLAEYSSNVVAYLQQAKQFGVEIIFVPNDEFGQIDTKALTNLIDEKVKLISITHIPSGGGLVNPAVEVGRIAKLANIPYLLDACQSVGQIPIDVNTIGCDILGIAGRKYLRGPRGTGLLYVKEQLIEQLEPPFLDQHAAQLISTSEYKVRSDAKRFESWEQYSAGKYALSAAIDYSLSWGLDNTGERIYYLADLLRRKLMQVDSIQLTDGGAKKCGIVTFFSKNIGASEAVKALAAKNINVSSSQGAGSLVAFNARGVTEVVRASVHYYNTSSEIDYFVDTLEKIVTNNS